MTTNIRDILDENGCWIFSGSLEEGFALLKNHSVPILDLRDIPCASIPKSISKITDLEEVYLDNNGLPELPTQIGAISKLRILSLGRNKITEIPDSIEQRWISLQKLFLGHNQIRTLPFDEEHMSLFKQGSVGSNPIEEPISPLWMIRKDVAEYPEKIRLLCIEQGSLSVQQEMYNHAFFLTSLCTEPMLYEHLFAGVEICTEHDSTTHTIVWNEIFTQNKWMQLLGWELLPHIPRGSVVHRSLDAWKLPHYKFAPNCWSNLPHKPNWIQNPVAIESGRSPQ